jgi:hypothetical protein
LFEGKLAEAITIRLFWEYCFLFSLPFPEHLPIRIARDYSKANTTVIDASPSKSARASYQSRGPGNSVIGSSCK